MVINEIFYSMQGEGLLAGVPSVFIRLAGCPLHCTWCDTKYALDPAAGEDLSIGQIIDKVDNIKHSPPSTRRPQSSGLLTERKNRINSANSAVSAVKVWPKSKYVVITGGEPMVNAELPELVTALKKQGKHITIETAGIKFVPGLACDLMSISPKLSNSRTKKVLDTFFPEAVRQLISHYPYQLKFVVDSPDDLPEILQAVPAFGDVSPGGESLGNVDPTRIMLMPQAKTRDELIAKSPMVAELCAKTGFTFCSRLQILLYDGERGK
jgi:7-carboxy-7-deazaguanine synthase